MKIKAKIDRIVNNQSNVKAFASINIGGGIVVKDIAIMSGKKGLFAKMPSRAYQDRQGITQYSDVVYATSQNVRRALNDAVLSAYEQHMKMEETEIPEMEEEPEIDPAMPEEIPAFEQSM